MIFVLSQDLQPLGGKFYGSPVRILERGGHFQPYVQPEYVAVIIKAFVLDLLMLADAVEAQRAHRLHVVYDLLFVGRVPAVREIALIEHHFQIHGIVVDRHVVLFRFITDQSEIGCGAVDLLPVFIQEIFHVVQFGRVRKPEMFFERICFRSQIESLGEMRAAHGAFVLRDGRSVKRNPRFQPEIVPKTRDIVLESRGIVGNICRDLGALEITLPYVFQPYALPDARRFGVPATERPRLPLLLSARLRTRFRILAAHDDLRIFSRQILRYVEGKARVRSLMAADKCAVYPDFGKIVRALEM